MAWSSGSTVSAQENTMEQSTLPPGYLEEIMQYPQREALYIVLPITVAYCIILITGITGNITTCLVISANKYMHTNTNYYLFNLAMADLLFLVLGMPQELYILWNAYPWIFGEIFCITRVFASETATYASILTITAFTVERYVAICHPMRSQLAPNLGRAVKVIGLIWFVSALCSIPTAYQFGIIYKNDTRTNTFVSESAICGVEESRQIPYSFTASSVVFFVVPMTIISVLYALIGIAIKRSVLSRTGSDTSSSSQQHELRSQQQLKSRRSVLKMLVAVVIAFFVCWAPYHAQRLMARFVSEYVEHKMATDILYYVSGILFYFNSTINPILYNIMSLKFRQAFKSTICRPCRPRKRSACTSYRFRSHPDTHCTHVIANKTFSCVRGNKNSSSQSGSSAKMMGDDPFDGEIQTPTTPMIIRLTNGQPQSVLIKQDYNRSN